MNFLLASPSPWPRQYHFELASYENSILTTHQPFNRDNGYDLYVNGINIGNDNEKFGLVSAFEEADTYNIPLNAEGQNIIAINVTNAGSTPTPAGVIVTGVIQFSNGLQQVLVSDSSWVTLAAQTPVNFFEVTFDDAAWIPASEQGTNGVGPWGITTIVPNTIECPNF